MTMLPVYVVTGFLDAGKTTFLNELLSHREWKNTQILVVQFEAGEEEFKTRYKNCHWLSFPNRALINESLQIARKIKNSIESNHFDEIWIEWNGVVPLSHLHTLLLASSLSNQCKLQKVIHIADALTIENLLGRTGGTLPEQIANSDFAVIRNTSSRNTFKKVRHTLNGINSGIPTFLSSNYNSILKNIYWKKEPLISSFFQTIIILIVLYFIIYPVSEVLQVPFNTFINVFLGIILQAIPFLLIGVLLSSAIQIFIPKSLIERRFPKSVGLGMLLAVISGFCLPVCDCASIPIFRSLIKKGIPLPVALTFMTATPVINPVVILSTYYAFNGDISIVVSRICFGILAGVTIGVIFEILPKKYEILSGGSLDRFMCSCGCYEDIETISSLKGKISLFFRHSQAEFFQVGKFLILGTFFASVFQVSGTRFFTDAQNGAGLALSIIIMMVMAFVLSLCSSSDAIIARSFANQFPMGAIMGFLVFGPMMDIKNVMMLASGFSKRFIAKLLFVTFFICFIIVFLYSSLGGI